MDVPQGVCPLVREGAFGLFVVRVYCKKSYGEHSHMSPVWTEIFILLSQYRGARWLAHTVNVCWSF